VVVTLTDGGRGDADGVANGIVVDPGVLAYREVNPVYVVRLESGDRYYTTDAAEAGRMARGTGNVFEGAAFDAVAPADGGMRLYANHQPFTDDWYFAFAGVEMPYSCYEPKPTAAGFTATSAGQGAGTDYHLYLNTAGLTWMATPAEAAARGLAGQGYRDLGAKFNTTSESAFGFDAEGYLVENQTDAGVRALVATLAQGYQSTSAPGFVEAVEQHYLAQVALTGVEHGDPATAADVNLAFGTQFGV
jgi:hypothetical protein